MSHGYLNVFGIGKTSTTWRAKVNEDQGWKAFNGNSLEQMSVEVFYAAAIQLKHNLKTRNVSVFLL